MAFQNAQNYIPKIFNENKAFNKIKAVNNIAFNENKTVQHKVI